MITNTPLSIVNMATTIYWLAIVKYDVIHNIFPSFTDFVVIGVICYYIGNGIFGYWYLKSRFYKKGDREVDIENDPYSTTKVPPVTAAMWKIAVDFYEKQGLDCSEVRKILERSEN